MVRRDRRMCPAVYLPCSCIVRKGVGKALKWSEEQGTLVQGQGNCVKRVCAGLPCLPRASTGRRVYQDH